MVSDFALVDAIECGIVKLPRVPVSDNAVNADMPVFRNLWDHIGKEMPKKGAGKSGELDPLVDPRTSCRPRSISLYSHYEEEFDEWKRAGIAVPPVFIVVCNNTASSKLVYEWISGWEREGDGEKRTIHHGHLELFRNYRPVRQSAAAHEHAADRQPADRIRRGARPEFPQAGGGRDRAVPPREGAARGRGLIGDDLRLRASARSDEHGRARRAGSASRSAASSRSRC